MTVTMSNITPAAPDAGLPPGCIALTDGGLGGGLLGYQIVLLTLLGTAILGCRSRALPDLSHWPRDRPQSPGGRRSAGPVRPLGACAFTCLPLVPLADAPSSKTTPATARKMLR